MDLYNLRNNMRSRYFSMWEYLNNGFEIFKMFVKNHPLIVFIFYIFNYYGTFYYVSIYRAGNKDVWIYKKNK